MHKDPVLDIRHGELVRMAGKTESRKLFYNYCCIDSAVLLDICDALKNNTNRSVEELYLQDNNISDFDATCIANLILENPGIRKIDLSGNRLGPQGKKIIQEAQEQSAIPVEVILSENSSVEQDNALEMFEALQNPNCDVLEFINLKKVDFTMTDKAGNNIFHHLAMNDLCNEMEVIFLKHLAQFSEEDKKKLLNAPNLENNAPLHLASMHNCLGSIKSLLSLGASYLSKNLQGNTALGLATTPEALKLFELYPNGRVPNLLLLAAIKLGKSNSDVELANANIPAHLTNLIQFTQTGVLPTRESEVQNVSFSDEENEEKENVSNLSRRMSSVSLEGDVSPNRHKRANSTLETTPTAPGLQQVTNTVSDSLKKRR